MTIEIHSPHLKVDEMTLKKIEKKIVTLSNLSEHISRAEIFLTEGQSIEKENKICKIRLNLTNDELFISKNGASFEKAAGDAIKVLKNRLKQKNEKRNNPPDEITSTVKV